MNLGFAISIIIIIIIITISTTNLRPLIYAIMTMLISIVTSVLRTKLEISRYCRKVLNLINLLSFLPVGKTH